MTGRIHQNGSFARLFIGLSGAVCGAFVAKSGVALCNAPNADVANGASSREIGYGYRTKNARRAETVRVGAKVTSEADVTTDNEEERKKEGIAQSAVCGLTMQAE